MLLDTVKGQMKYLNLMSHPWLVSRNIKMANTFLDGDGNAVIKDLGQPKLVNEKVKLTMTEIKRIPTTWENSENNLTNDEESDSSVW